MVSIITPTHFKSELWELTVESVLQQTCKDFEWIVLDNSEDEYFKDSFLKFKESHPEYEDVYDNVKIFKMKTQDKMPVGYYKNMCVSLTSCSDDDFVLVLDHDDFIANTTVEDIINCDKKYKNKLDYITGFAVCLTYDKSNGLFALFNNFNPELNVNIKNITPVTIGKDFKLSIEQTDVSQYVILDYTNFVNGLNSHPRAIRKRVLYNNIFRFHENSVLEEDTPQVYLAPLFLNIGWIARATVCYIIYKDGDKYRNTCVHQPYNRQTHIDNETLKTALTLIYEGARHIVGDNMLNKMFMYDDFAYDGTTNPTDEWVENINKIKETCFR